jgi:hypothetical protein
MTTVRRRYKPTPTQYNNTAKPKDGPRYKPKSRAMIKRWISLVPS